MIDWMRKDVVDPDHADRDPMLAEAFAALDPAALDPNYWLRFRGWVTSSAAAELARRRIMSELTVVDVLNSWARTLVPAAALAAAVAGMMLARGAPTPQPLGLEELLVTELPGETVPVLLAPDETQGVVVAFASETY